jgi:hypothetical protein
VGVQRRCLGRAWIWLHLTLIKVQIKSFAYKSDVYLGKICLEKCCIGQNRPKTWNQLVYEKQIWVANNI